MAARHVVSVVAFAVAVALSGFVGAAAQEVSFKGAVAAIEIEKGTIQVKTVGDDGTPTGKLNQFVLTAKTRVVRGDKAVPLADAKILLDESVTIVVAHGDEAGIEWTCSMHPAVALPGPGRCPQCGMTLKQRNRPAKASEIRLSAK